MEKATTDGATPGGATTSSSFLELAEELAQPICEAAVHARDGTTTWCFLYPEEDGAQKRLFLGPHVYAGVTGIAVFFAALARITQNPDYERLCLRAIEPIRREGSAMAGDPRRAAEVRHVVGGLCGLGSFVYALLKVGDLLEQPDLYRDAHLLAALITPERIEQDPYFDVMSGSAGTLLALLALDRQRPGATANGHTPLGLAIACGRHLLRRRVAYQQRPRAWAQAEGDRPTAGFAHGAAGICHALLMLAERTGDRAFHRAAVEGLAYERTMFVAEEKNWIASFGSGIAFSNSWCNGAPGVAIGRMASLHLHDDGEVREDLRHGLATTGAAELNDGDYLCCGNLGRVEALLFASQRGGDPALREAAEGLATQVIERARSVGSFALMPGERFLFDPRLFVGLTGVAYGFLRLAAPETLPCLLALE